MRLSGRGPVNSLTRITLENIKKIRPQPDRENAFARASGGGHGSDVEPSLSPNAAQASILLSCPFDRAGFVCRRPVGEAEVVHVDNLAPSDKGGEGRAAAAVTDDRPDAVEPGRIQHRGNLGGGLQPGSIEKNVMCYVACAGKMAVPAVPLKVVPRYSAADRASNTCTRPSSAFRSSRKRNPTGPEPGRRSSAPAKSGACCGRVVEDSTPPFSTAAGRPKY